MNGQHRRLARKIARGALVFSLLAASPMIVGAATAQTTIIDPNAAKTGLSSHDAALDAARRGEYVSAVELAKKAAAEGQPLDADQLDFMTGKAAKQQAAMAEAAKLKASQEAAAGTAQQILSRQQKEYSARVKEAKDVCDQASAGHHIGTFTSAAGAMAASSTGVQNPKYTGADGGKRDGCS